MEGLKLWDPLICYCRPLAGIREAGGTIPNARHLICTVPKRITIGTGSENNCTNLLTAYRKTGSGKSI
jgi:hypothetical protein